MKNYGLVITNRPNILSMVACGYDYGHRNEVADDFFWRLLKENLCDEEIKQFAEHETIGDEYTEVDKQAVVAILTDFRTKMLK